MLSFYKYPGDDVPVIKGSALCALEGHDDNIGKEKVLELMKTVDEYFPLVRSFSMNILSSSISSTLSISSLYFSNHYQ